jgi:anti-sigma regulatory factor (Ser/Thr protein kinase)
MSIADPAIVPEVRHRIIDDLRSNAARGADLGAAELILTELLGNAFRHGGGSARVALDWSEDGAVLSVWDDGPPFDANPGLPTDPTSTSGRGLFIVRALARELSVERTDGGNRVRAVLPIDFDG